MEYHALDSLKYSYLWNKYRPVVLKLMVDATNGPQQYQFLKHEFHDINPKEKGGHSFAIEVSNGRPSKEVKASAVAKSLFAVLDRSTKASELTEGATYGFALDKQYMLHINLEKVEEVEEVEDASPEAIVTPDAEESSEVEVTPEAKESSKD